MLNTIKLMNKNFYFSVCEISGGYYCENCISPDLHMIPAKIIYNWDFKPYIISEESAKFIKSFKTEPFIDLKVSTFFLLYVIYSIKPTNKRIYFYETNSSILI